MAKWPYLSSLRADIPGTPPTQFVYLLAHPDQGELVSPHIVNRVRVGRGSDNKMNGLVSQRKGSGISMQDQGAFRADLSCQQRLAIPLDTFPEQIQGAGRPLLRVPMRTAMGQIARQGYPSGFGHNRGGERQEHQSAETRVGLLPNSRHQRCQFLLGRGQEPVVQKIPGRIVQTGAELPKFFRPVGLEPLVGPDQRPSGRAGQIFPEHPCCFCPPNLNRKRVQVYANPPVPQQGCLHNRGTGTRHRVQDGFSFFGEVLNEEAGKLGWKFGSKRVKVMGSVSGLCPPEVQVARQQGRQPFPSRPRTRGF